MLVVGGGDGGTLRELAKHACVEEIHICEIDEVCISLCAYMQARFVHVVYMSECIYMHVCVCELKHALSSLVPRLLLL